MWGCVAASPIGALARRFDGWWVWAGTGGWAAQGPIDQGPNEAVRVLLTPPTDTPQPWLQMRAEATNLGQSCIMVQTSGAVAGVVLGERAWRKGDWLEWWWWMALAVACSGPRGDCWLADRQSC